MKRIVGITGGIGSGKSTVARLLEAQGYPLYYADLAARRLQEDYAPLRQAMMRRFGPEIYTPEGKLDRKRLGALVFADAQALQDLNALVHPETKRDFEEWCAARFAEGHTLVFKEAAILFEAGAAAGLTGVLMVYAPRTVRVARVQARDGLSPQEIGARMDWQWPDAWKMALADFIVYNDGQHALEPQIAAALHHFRA